MSRRLPQAQLPPELSARYRAWGLVTDEPVSVLLARSTRRWPHRPALIDVVDGRETLTYAALTDRVERLAAFLRDRGLGPGDVISIQSPNCSELVVSCYAAWHIGAVCNPIVDIYREHELRGILAQARPDAVISIREHREHDHTATFDTLLDELDLAPAAKVVLRGDQPGWTAYEAAIAGAAHQGGPEIVPADDPALLLFTSGTTSAPKGVVHSSRSIVADAHQMSLGWSLGWDDRVYHAAPIAHVAGVEMALTLPSLRGGSVVLSRVTTQERAAQEILEHGATVVASAPSMFTVLARACEESGLERLLLRVFVSGGTNVSPALIEQAEELGIRPARIYGMTELPSVTVPCPSDPPRWRLETDGPLPPGVDCEAVEPATREPLARGEEGELRVRGPERMLGYLDPEQSAAQLDADGWFYTGDLGRVDDERCVTITGRIKDIINRGGEKFSARDIEDVLVAHPGIAGVAVVAGPDRRYGEVPAAFLVARPGAPRPDEAELRTLLADRGVARQKTPVHWRWVDELPVNASGKVKKFELVAGLAAELAGTEPASPTA